MRKDLQQRETNLPTEAVDIVRKVKVGRELLTAAKAELNAMDKLGVANSIRLEKLIQAQDLAEQVLDAEVSLGYLIASMPEAQGTRSDLEPLDSAVHKFTKKESIEAIGLTVRQANRFESLASHPEIVEAVKIEARNNGEIISRDSVLKAITESRKPYIVNNSHNSEWFTPSCYIESARIAMGNIDLDPASCETANKTVRADVFYSSEDDGLSQEWSGNVWLNPPYDQIQKFAEKLIGSDEVKQAVVLTNNATETRWFQSLLEKASALVFHLGRLRFTKPDGTASAPMQGQVFFYFGSNADGFVEEFGKYGFAIKLQSNS